MPKLKQWIVNPEVDLVNTLANCGRFLEDDYRTMIDWMSIPLSFEEFTEKTNRRFVIVGAKSVPGATAKSVFLCLKLSGAESVTIKAPTTDEHLLIANVVEHHCPIGTSVEIFSDSSDELKLDTEWRSAVDNATDIVVFGGEETVNAFTELESTTRRVWVHGPKFSFGIVRAWDLTPTIIKDICSDFYSFYGEGCLSPKFYVILGEVNDKLFQEISDTMRHYYGSYIDEFRSKLPLTRKSELAQQFISANYKGKYIRLESLSSDKIFTTLYGDARFVVIDDLQDLEKFIERWGDHISTVAVEDEDDELQELLADNLITRICNYGEMQFPGFFEQFDVVDDFDIYVGEEEE